MSLKNKLALPLAAVILVIGASTFIWVRGPSSLGRLRERLGSIHPFASEGTTSRVGPAVERRVALQEGNRGTLPNQVNWFVQKVPQVDTSAAQSSAIPIVASAKHEMRTFDEKCRSLAIPDEQSRRLHPIAETVMVSKRIISKISDDKARREAEGRLDQQVQLAAAGIVDAKQREAVTQLMLEKPFEVEQ